MSDAPRDVRDRLGEAVRLFLRPGHPTQWTDLHEDMRAHWRADGDRLIALAASCGLKIVPDDDGETK